MYTKLALTEDSAGTGSVQVSWISAIAEQPVVRFGPSSGNYTDTVREVHSATYSAADMCGAPANIHSATLFRPPGWIHTATLRGLAPGADS
eukprot:401245-Pyramimonas_sp.AAC.1